MPPRNFQSLTKLSSTSDLTLRTHLLSVSLSPDLTQFRLLDDSTPESWGSYAMKDNEMEVRLANSELGVLERVRASSWKKLVAKVNEIVPYDRTSLEPYKRNDFPCPTPEPRVVEKRGKKKKGEEDEDDD